MSVIERVDVYQTNVVARSLKVKQANEVLVFIGQVSDVRGTVLCLSSLLTKLLIRYLSLVLLIDISYCTGVWTFILV